MQPELINLGLGHPGADLLPLAEFQRMAASALSSADTALLQYGAKQGSPAFRAALAGVLEDSLGLATSPDSLLITAGASQGLDLVCTVLSEPGDVVFVEEPTYFLALLVFAGRGLRVRGIPVDQDGLVIEALEDALAEERPAFLYTIPTYQNPTGVTLSEERRRRLVELSRQHDLVIVADEVYQLLGIGEPPPAPLLSFDPEGLVVSVSSFSKILGPGLRLGWIQTSPKVMERFLSNGMLRSGGGLNPITAAIVGEGLASGFQREHLGRLRGEFKARLDSLVSAVREELPEAEFIVPGGGYFLWVRLPGVDAQQLAVAAKEQGVAFHPGPAFSSRGGLREYVRLSWSFYDAEELAEGIGRLAQAAKPHVAG
ncbi:MAG: PLP-dependent aminotransferase family protein [Trueperaceae bacterium]|nr:PLP-dependent aminotransferase family protein [Trueperaceae bacterium]